MTTDILLALDPGNSCGYAIFEVKGKVATILEYGTINLDPSSSEYVGDHGIELMERVREIVEEHGVTRACVEDYYMNRFQRNGASVNYEYRMALYIVLRQLDLHYDIVAIPSWKAHIKKRIKATEDQKKLWGKNEKKLIIQYALEEKYGIYFPSTVTREKEIGKRKPSSRKLPSDLVDAVAQGIYIAETRMGVTEIVCPIQPE